MRAGGNEGAASAAAIVVNYNGGPALVRCLAALRRSDFGGRPVVLVDNASRDGSAKQAAARTSEVELLELRKNVGFAAGVNAALPKLLSRGYGSLLLLNPDTEVAPGFFAPLAQALTEGASIAGPKLLLERAPGEAGPPLLWSAGGRVTFGRNLALLEGHRERDRGQHDAPRDVSFLPGTAWLARRDVFESVGLLDDSFFCYVEDVDYCVRAAAKGHRLRYEPRSVVWHAGSAASGGGYTALRKYLNAAGGFRLLRKHGTPGRWLRFLAGDVLTLPFALAYAALRGRPEAALWKARGLLDGWRGRAFEGARRAALLPGEAA
jgi:GT2 family glycosyltransferase